MRKLKKIFAFFLTCAASLGLAFGFSACDSQGAGNLGFGGGEESPNCEEVGHDFVVDEENSVAATCQTDGLLVEKCQRKNCETTQETTVLAYGHTYVDGECACGDREYPDIAEYLKYTLNQDGASYSVSFWESAEEAEQARIMDLIDFGLLYPQAEVQGVFKLPAEYEGLPVTGIAEYGFAYYSFENIKIPETLTTIGDGAFKGCELRGIELPNAVAEIGASAFADCDLLESVTLPDSLTRIEEKTFQACSRLTEIQLPQTLVWIGDYAFAGCAISNVAIPDTVTAMGNYVYNGSSVTSVTFGKGITEIPQGGFEHCVQLLRVEFLGKVTAIGAEAFRYCERLTGVILPETLTAIGAEAFRFCHGLTEIEIPQNVSDIGNLAFEYCQNLTRLVCTHTVKNIGNFAFSSIPVKEAKVTVKTLSVLPTKELETITITSGTTIEDNLFNYCKNLKSVVFECDIIKIGERAFEGCESLTDIEFPASLKTIESFAFTDSGLTEVKITGSVTEIGEYAFAGCANLTDVTIGKEVEFIGAYAFSRCEKAVVAFENAEGWVVGGNGYDIGKTEIPATDLQASEKATAYLTETYAEFSWERKQK